MKSIREELIGIAFELSVVGSFNKVNVVFRPESASTGELTIIEFNTLKPNELIVDDQVFTFMSDKEGLHEWCDDTRQQILTFFRGLLEESVL